MRLYETYSNPETPELVAFAIDRTRYKIREYKGLTKIRSPLHTKASWLSANRYKRATR